MLATADTVANEVRLSRGLVSGPFLITEGALDSRVYRRALDPGVQTIVGRGRDNVAGAIEILDREGVPGVLGVLDADFARLKGAAIDAPNILYTDYHDVEGMLLVSPALDKVLEVFGSPPKIAAFAAAYGGDVRGGLLTAAAPLGALRLVSVDQDLRLDFNGITYSRFVDRRTLAVDIARMVRVVTDNSRQPRLDATALAGDVRAAVDHHGASWQLCCGDDLVHLLSIGLTSALGSATAYAVSPDAVAKVLELAFEADWFHASSLNARMVQWEARSGGYALCRRGR